MCSVSLCFVSMMSCSGNLSSASFVSGRSKLTAGRQHPMPIGRKRAKFSSQKRSNADESQMDEWQLF